MSSLRTKFSEVLQKTRNNALPDNEKTGLEPYDELTIDQAVDEILLSVKEEMLDLLSGLERELIFSDGIRRKAIPVSDIKERLEAIK